MKTGIKTIGIDEGHWTRKDRETVLIGAVVRGNIELEGVLKTNITVDGDDGTDRIIDMVGKSRFYPQLKAIFTNSVILAGVNVIDIQKIHKELGIPVIAILRKVPQTEKLIKGIKEKFPEKVKQLKEYGIPKKIGNIYYYASGENVEKLIKITIRRGNIPEPIRLAHIIASGITLGESRGRA